MEEEEEEEAVQVSGRKIKGQSDSSPSAAAAAALNPQNQRNRSIFAKTVQNSLRNYFKSYSQRKASRQLCRFICEIFRLRFLLRQTETLRQMAMRTAETVPQTQALLRQRFRRRRRRITAAPTHLQPVFNKRSQSLKILLLSPIKTLDRQIRLTSAVKVLTSPNPAANSHGETKQTDSKPSLSIIPKPREIGKEVQGTKASPTQP